jgi:5-formyltetrahydrofolate cyclo-ligase
LSSSQFPTSASTNNETKSKLRSVLRKRRRSLTPGQRRTADRKLCARIRRIPAYLRARNIAGFIAFDGEPSLAELLVPGKTARRTFCVPVIRSERMIFAPLESHKRMRRNRFGIAEPRHRPRVPTRTLDIVLVPLVGFDADGHRLGMGGGFYDRYFSFLRARTHYRRPRLIGVAYENQRLPELPTDPWDVPLWAIVTEQRIYRP